MATFRAFTIWPACLIAAALWARPVAAAQFAGGTGTPSDPYQIATPAQLVSIGSDPGLLEKHYILVNDIDLDPNKPGGKVFTQAPIAAEVAGLGSEPLHLEAFVGTFNGCGHVIRKLTIQGDGRFLGLFGGVSSPGRVIDLGVEEVDIRGGRRVQYVGGLAGQNSKGLIANCHVTGFISVEDSGRQIGGLVGRGHGGTLLNCYATASVTAGATAYSVGCLVGEGGSLVECWTTGKVTVGDSRSQMIGGLIGCSGGNVALCWAGGSVSGGAGCTSVGGLAGYCLWGYVVNSCATGDVRASTTSSLVGGLIGDTWKGVVSHCFSTGKVTASRTSSLAHGLIGGGEGSCVVDHCFWDQQASGLSDSGGPGTALPTIAMRQALTFRKAGWDWVGETANGTADLWKIPAKGGYPVLTVFSPEYQRRALNGTGTPDDPYILSSAEDLGALCHYDRLLCYRLGANIDLAGITWATVPIPAFYGSFDGNDFALSHLTIDGAARLALFDEIGEGAVVTNLGVVDANITAETRDSAILAIGNAGAISDCHVSGTITQRFATDRTGSPVQVVGHALGRFGGLVEYNAGTITRCAAVVGISVGDRAPALPEDDQFVGGLVGVNYSRIIQCSAVANIRAGDYAQYLGGLVGMEYSVGDWLITDCYATGSIAAGEDSKYLGGLVGWCEGQVVNSYAAVSIAAGERSKSVYGLTGGEGSVITSFWDIDISGLTTSPGATGLTTTQMRSAAPFLTAGWDFDKTWTIREGEDYPRLQWAQEPPTQ